MAAVWILEEGEANKQLEFKGVYASKEAFRQNFDLSPRYWKVTHDTAHNFIARKWNDWVVRLSLWEPVEERKPKV